MREKAVDSQTTSEYDDLSTPTTCIADFCIIPVPAPLLNAITSEDDY